jgi:Coenzyme PQQ synthesis protein D (PqqD)
MSIINSDSPTRRVTHTEPDTMSESESKATAQPVDPSDYITVSAVAVGAPGDADCVVHNLETNETYRLNDIGARIWELLESGSTIATLAGVLRDEYRLPDDLQPEQVQLDVAAVVADLHQKGLLVVTPSGSAQR